MVIRCIAATKDCIAARKAIIMAERNILSKNCIAVKCYSISKKIEVVSNATE